MKTGKRVKEFILKCIDGAWQTTGYEIVTSRKKRSRMYERFLFLICLISEIKYGVKVHIKGTIEWEAWQQGEIDHIDSLMG